MTIPLINRSPNSRQYVYALSAAWQLGTWIPDPDWGLSNDPEIWEKMQRDPVIKHAIEQRLHVVATQDPIIEPGGPTPLDARLADTFERALTYLGNFPAVRYAASKHVMLGRWYGFVEGKRVWKALLPGQPILPWWVPTGIKEIDRRRVQFVPMQLPREDGTKALHVRTELWSIAQREWVPIDPMQLVRLVYDDEEARLGYGRGILGAIYYYHYARGILLREGLQGVERWAQGLTVAKVDNRANASTGKALNAHKRAWLDAIEKMRARHALVFGKEDEVEVLWPSGTGHTMVRELLEYLDRGVTQLILGSVLPTGGGGDVGSNARAKVEQSSTDALVQFDRRCLDEAFTRDLIGRFVRLNQANLRYVGLSAAATPRMRSTQVSKEDPNEFADLAEKVLRSGAPIAEEEFYRRAGLRKPNPGEPVIKQQPQAQPGMPGMPGGLGGDGAEPGGDQGDGTLSGRPYGAEDERPQDRAMHAAASGASSLRLEFREEQHPRKSGGEFAPKGEGEESGKNDDSAEPEKPATPPQSATVKRAPGTQLPPETQARLHALGVTKFPAADVAAASVKVHALEGEDVHARAVMTWRDAGGKTQHAYTPEFHARNAAKKWARVEQFEPRVHKVRAALGQRLSTTEHASPEHQGATIAAVIAHTGLRPGGEAGSTARGRFGVSTLRAQHVTIDGDGARLDYVGKAGKRNVGTVSDSTIVESLRRYKEEAAARGGESEPLFAPRALEFARSEAPKGVKLKDFRTVVATHEAAKAMRGVEAPPPPLPASEKAAAKLILARIRAASAVVAKRLNNTPAVARAAYIHPRIFAAWIKSVGGRPEWAGG